jgi:nitroimidazol reductase NimA-like FMN-containing flavoprotein (pyridoxamine 5'-phosphate oxidase superfamily)
MKSHPGQDSMPQPRFGVLTTDECWKLLRENRVARLAFLHEGTVNVEPVTYAAGDSWLFMRSAEGTKLTALAHHPYAAAEVDQVDDAFNWRSVVVRGTIYVMSEIGSRVDRHQFQRALEALRTVSPAALTTDDRTPLRTTIYGIHVDEISGRVATDRPDTELISAPPPRQSGRRRATDGF